MLTEPIGKANNTIYLIDYSIFTALMVFLVVIVLSSGMANIQTDAIDYYAILQRLTQNGGNPIVRNLHFVEQRSPGYPVLALIPYSLISSFVEPFVQTEEIVTLAQRPEPPAQAPTEQMLLPGQPLLLSEVFFKNYYIDTEDSWFEWKIITSLLVTSYALAFIGLIFVVKTLALEHRPFQGVSFVPLVLISSSVFMHNLVKTPAYATLTAFGISCLFAYYFVKGFLEKRPLTQLLAGVFIGLLVLTRLETIVIATVVLVALAIVRDLGFLKNYVLGASLAAVVLLGYNYFQFGSPFHMAILAGDINLIALDWGYIYANRFNPHSGILIWSGLASLGVIGLLLGGKPHARILGIGSLALIALVLIRVPVMYSCIGEGTRIIEGLPISCPNSMAEMETLIRFDANRYIIVLYPFSILGLQALVVSAPALWHDLRRILTIRRMSV